MVLGIAILPILILGCAKVVAARQERRWTRALMGQRWRVFQAPAGLEHLKEGLDAESFAGQHLVQQGQQRVLPFAALPVTR